MAGNDWSGLEQLEANFEDFLKEFMESMGALGEMYVKGGHGGISIPIKYGSFSVGSGSQKWNNDTGSLATSITGYEADIGNHMANFETDPWYTAQQWGSEKYKQNVPEHYRPADETEVDTGDAMATAVLSAWTRYPDETAPNDAWLNEAVEETLNEAADFVVEHIPAALESAFQKDPSIPISNVLGL